MEYPIKKKKNYIGVITEDKVHAKNVVLQLWGGWLTVTPGQVKRNTDTSRNTVIQWRLQYFYSGRRRNKTTPRLRPLNRRYTSPSSLLGFTYSGLSFTPLRLSERSTGRETTKSRSVVDGCWRTLGLCLDWSVRKGLKDSVSLILLFFYHNKLRRLNKFTK